LIHNHSKAPRARGSDGYVRIWIDATQRDRSIRVFGMTLLERLLHAVRTVDAELEEVRVELPGSVPVPSDLPAGIVDALPLRWSAGDGPMSSRLDRALEDTGGGPLIVLAADTVIDTRVVHHLCAANGTVAFRSGEGEERGAALRLEGSLRSEGADLAPRAEPLSVLRLADDLVERGIAKELAEDDFDSYLAMLRRSLAPYLFRVANPAARDRVEHFLFWSNYKGSTDLLTRYVYPPFVWIMVRSLARWRVHPNWVTGISWLATAVSLPLFAVGAWVPALALSYLMSVLDSVDGKLARLTYKSSRFGLVFDHALDIIHPPLWYMAWGYALGGGHLTSAPFQWSLWMLAFYVADRAITGIFKGRTKRSIHGFTALDERMRTFISRRNVNLALFTVALALDWAIPGLRAAEFTFYGIVIWQVLCFAWHAERLVQFWNARPQP
jgi:phosphatidylglycerophosphate synthase